MGLPSLTRSRIVFAALLLSTVAAALCRAGVITGATGAPVPDTWVEGNDNTDFSDNFGQYPLTFTVPAPIDIVFTVTDTTTTTPTEYDFWGDLDNDTGLPWTGLRLELGFGTGSGFTLATLPGLDFDTPDRDSFVVFNSYDPDIHTDVVLEWTDVEVDAPTVFMSIDVPNADSAFIPASALTTGGYMFTLRHIPLGDFPLQLPPLEVIPEPGTGLLAIAAIAGHQLVRGRRVRQRG